MSERVDQTKIEGIVGVKRDPRLHYARIVSAEQMIYILHSQECRDSTPDLRECPFSEAMDRGIEVSEWIRDAPVLVEIDEGGVLRPQVGIGHG